MVTGCGAPVAVSTDVDNSWEPASDVGRTGYAYTAERLPLLFASVFTMVLWPKCGRHISRKPQCLISCALPCSKVKNVTLYRKLKLQKHVMEQQHLHSRNMVWKFLHFLRLYRPAYSDIWCQLKNAKLKTAICSKFSEYWLKSVGKIFHRYSWHCLIFKSFEGKLSVLPVSANNNNRKTRPPSYKNSGLMLVTHAYMEAWTNWYPNKILGASVQPSLQPMAAHTYIGHSSHAAHLCNYTMYKV